MKPQSLAFLEKAEQALEKSRRVLEIRIPDEAGRHAYYAAFHAAQALIFQHPDKAAKSHWGVKSQFARLAKSDPLIDRQLPVFLIKAYHLKSVADYETNAANSITIAEAASALTMAERFVAVIRDVLSR